MTSESPGGSAGSHITKRPHIFLLISADAHQTMNIVSSEDEEEERAYAAAPRWTVAQQIEVIMFVQVCGECRRRGPGSTRLLRVATDNKISWVLVRSSSSSPSPSRLNLLWSHSSAEVQPLLDSKILQAQTDVVLIPLLIRSEGSAVC